MYFKYFKNGNDLTQKRLFIMKKQTVYFKFFDKPMKTTVPADTPYGAIEAVKKRLEIIRCEEVPEEKDDVVEKLFNMFNMKR